MARPDTAPADEPLVRVNNLTMAYGPRVLQRELSFDIRRGEVFAIMGGSGCGKSTLLRHLVGLQAPAAGQVRYGEQDLHSADADSLAALRRQFGVMFQAGALWSSMTVGENVMLPLQVHTALDAAAREAQARFKLALVGLADSFDAEPAALSGGMRKRAAIARAMALDPALLYLDEPSAGLDPPTSARLDELILQLRDHLGTTVVMVTHELDSLFAVADRALFLDAESQTMTALDSPQALLAHGPATVRAFLSAGGAARRAEPGEGLGPQAQRGLQDRLTYSSGEGST
ncbi:MAG: ATP-binding cassette domain-containing protein [Burkholderiales bacterium]